MCQCGNVASPNVASCQLGLGIGIGDIPALATFSFQDPREKFAEERKRRIGDDDVRFVAESPNLVRAEIAVAIKVRPLQVVEVDASVAVRVAVEHEDASARRIERPPFREVEQVESVFGLLRLRRVARADEFLEAEAFEILGEEPREIAPFRIGSRTQTGKRARQMGSGTADGSGILQRVHDLPVKAEEQIGHRFRR